MAPASCHTRSPQLDRSQFIASLEQIVGRRQVLTSAAAMRAHCQGYRFGSGSAVAVVRPGTLVEQWRVFDACVKANRIVVVQAANTGLTGGSTPFGDDYDREVVVISTRRIRGIHLIDGGRQVVCLAGATLDRLEKVLAPLDREPHSVIGSSCLGASVIGGICNNSGGALVRRGPAFTQMALFARVTADRRVELINHLGLKLDGTPEEMLAALEAGRFHEVQHCQRLGSDQDYGERVRDVTAASPARFNADPERLFEASGSAGKVMVFAVRLDSFERPERPMTFYIGTNDPLFLANLRRDLLTRMSTLPIAAEYMDRECYDLAQKFGRDTFFAVRALGTSRLPWLFGAKNWVDSLASRLKGVPNNAADRMLQAIARLLPDPLPAKMNRFRDRFQHHLLLKVEASGVAEIRDYLESVGDSTRADFFECTVEEAECAFLHRFVAAGAAIRLRDVQPDKVGDIISLDVALPRNAMDWTNALPGALDEVILGRISYGHFLCHVFHLDYVIARGCDPAKVKQQLLRHLEARGAVYPAEHNVGHLYAAGQAQAAHFRALDPANIMNPGIGHTSRRMNWQ